MAENNIAGFKKLMRYAQNLAEYEQGIAEGIIDENVFVIVLEEKVAKFKGQTFDWSGGGEDIDISHLATKEELTNLANEMVANEEVHAGAYNDLNTRLNELSENVQGETVTKEEFNAAIEGVNNGISAKQDVLVSGTNIKTINNESILGSGNIEINVDTSSLASKEELQNLQNEVIANEEVVAAAFNDVNERINALAENVSGEAATKVELAESVETINATINANDKRYESEFTSLDNRIDELAANVSGETVTKVEFEETITNLTNEILDNEEVVASAFNDVNVRINAISENVSGGVGVAQLMTEVTYDELVALRDSASLVPGMYYRITDYETETSSANTMSAHHPFDIVVMALSKDTLSEDARAMQSERDIDGYFANSNLGAWELKYCLDNDINRFSWAKDIVTYLYADLLALEVGIQQAILNGSIVLQGVTYIRWDLTYSGVTLYLLTTNENPSEGDVVFVCFPDTEEIFEGGLVVKTETTTEKGKGVVYRLKDDNNNDVSYDFKNILFTRKLKDGQYDENDGVDSFVYTFNYNNGNANEDQSILFSWCRENKIFSTSSLPDNVFLSVSPICYGNILGGDSFQNTFLDSAQYITLKDNCYRNVFGNGCSYIELGGGCGDNIFGDDCSCISFASNCYGNILEKGCLFISLGHRCDTNTIGESCWSCIFGANCGENVLGSYCLDNSFGDSCENNVFGSSCSYNTFGDLCRNNVFGSSCSYNTFGNVCQHHVLGNKCDDIVFGENCYGNSIGAKNVDSYYKNIRLKNGVSFIALVNSEVAAWNSVVKNYTIGEIAGEDSSSIIEIEVFRNRIGATCVSKNSNGEIKQWNPADLVQ